MFQFVPITSCPVTRHYCKEPVLSALFLHDPFNTHLMEWMFKQLLIHQSRLWGDSQVNIALSSSLRRVVVQTYLFARYCTSLAVLICHLTLRSQCCSCVGLTHINSCSHYLFSLFEWFINICVMYVVLCDCYFWNPTPFCQVYHLCFYTSCISTEIKRTFFCLFVCLLVFILKKAPTMLLDIF